MDPVHPAAASAETASASGPASERAPGAPISGAAAFLAACRTAGMDTCFANPGTTELSIVRAFNEVPGWRVVPGLFEGVCTGAADGYARMLGRPALTLTHLGPGFANGIANLHNARRAGSAIVNLIGDHTTAHLPYDAPLTSDIDSLAKPVSAWVRHITDADSASDLAHQAVRQARAKGGQIATVIFAADAQAELTRELTSSGTTTDTAAAKEHEAQEHVTRVAADARAVQEAAERLDNSRALLLIGADALSERGLIAAQRIASHTGAALYCETFPARIERGAQLPAPERFPYFPEPASALIERMDSVVVVGAPEPVTYFGYPGYPSRIVPAEKLLMLAGPTDAATETLEALAGALGCAAFLPDTVRATRPASGASLDALTAARAIAAWLPENAIVSVEGGTCGYPFFTASAEAARHTVMTNTGGAIGQGLPVALGAALACPGRRVVCVQSDGSAQYTLQALWSMAREALPVTILIAANRRYAVLQNELYRDGMTDLSGTAASLTSLDNPPLDWTALGRGYGVASTSVTTCDELNLALDRALATSGPFLIEMLLP